MTKVNAHSSPTLQVNHEVGQMPIANTEHVVAHTECGMSTHKVGAEG